jgi:hypothetical protein
MLTEFRLGSSKGKDLGVAGMIILKLNLGRACGHVDWIHVAQDRSRLLAFVNTVMNIRFS